MLNRKLHFCQSIGLIAIALSATWVQAEAVYYRYIDKNGVPVLRSSIPPEYAQKGYEIVSSSGRVVKVVKPAPTEDEKQRLRTEVELAKWDAELRRRYSSVEEIVRAKNRKLENIDGNIQILRGNVGGIDTRIHQKRMEAANLERSGKPVNAGILKQLESLQVKRDATTSHIQQREEERQLLVDKYDEDIARFTQISGAKP